MKNAHDNAANIINISPNKTVFFLPTLLANILAGIKLNEKQILVCTTEMNTEEEIAEYIKAI